MKFMNRSNENKRNIEIAEIIRSDYLNNEENSHRFKLCGEDEILFITKIKFFLSQKHKPQMKFQ